MSILVAIPENGAVVAAEIARIANMPLERAYEALVALEARGKVRVLVEHVAGRRVALWARAVG